MRCSPFPVVRQFPNFPHTKKQNKTKQNKTKQKQQQQLQGAPSLKCSSYDYPFKKVPLSDTFFIVWLQNSHNDYDAFQKLMKSELFGCLFNLGRRGGLLTCKIYWDVSSNLVNFTQKVCKYGSHYDTKKNPETWG